MLNIPKAAPPNPIPDVILSKLQEAADDLAALGDARSEADQAGTNLAQLSKQAQQEIDVAQSQKNQADGAVTAQATKLDAVREGLHELVDHYFPSTPPSAPQPPVAHVRR